MEYQYKIMEVSEKNNTKNSEILISTILSGLMIGFLLGLALLLNL
jgi:hypothetical protein